MEGKRGGGEVDTKPAVVWECLRLNCGATLQKARRWPVNPMPDQEYAPWANCPGHIVVACQPSHGRCGKATIHNTPVEPRTSEYRVGSSIFDQKQEPM